MKKFINISAIACAAALLFGLASCMPEELDTAQYSEDAVTLASFGPNPVMRGAQLRFFGSNLQNIVEVQVPGVEPITQIEVVESGKVSEIRVTLPVEGPEIGFVSLKTGDGTTLQTKTELTYSEPIVFEGFDAPETAYPGNVVTLKGDYMNLVKHVVFEGGEIVPVQEGATRHEAKVKVPVTAVTGKIIVSDGAEVENLFYSEKDLVIGKPSVTELTKQKVKVGDNIVFAGTYLKMIKAVQFTKGEATEVVESFTIEEGVISVAVPATATDGAVKAISYAGDIFNVCEMVCILPSELAATNTPKAGSQLIVTGKNLDVVAKVDLAGAAGAAFELKDGKLEVTVPATATDGKALLYHANGASVELDYTIVHPAITNVSPLELYAGDEPVIVKGTDLDLVTTAKIGTKDVEISDKTETKLTLATAVTSVGGKVILTLGNGETLTSEQEVKMNYHSKVIVTSRPAAQRIGQEVVLLGSNMDLVESIFIGETKVTQYGLRTPEEIRFLMPWNKVGSYELKFQLYDGDVEVQADPIEVQLEISIKTIWEGEWSCGSWGGNQDLAWGGYDWSTAKPGDILTFEFELSGPDAWHQLDLRHGDGWGNLPTSGFQDLTEGQTYATYTLDATTIADLVANGGLVITGTSYILHKVTISREISQEVTLWEGEAIADNWGNQPYLLSDAGTELKNANAQVGQELRFYIEPLSDAWIFDIQEGHWGPIYKSVCSMSSNPDDPRFVKFDLESTGGYIPLTITQEMLDAAYTAGGWGGTFLINGDDAKFVKITLL